MWKSVAALMLVLTISGAICTPAQASDLPPQIQAGEHRLVLNGQGVRTKTFIQLYVAGLYLTRPSSNAAQVIAADEPMALRIQITSGFVSQSSLVASLEEGFENATGNNTRELRQQIDQFRKYFKDDIKKGDIFDMVYIPEYGVIVNKNGKLKGSVPGVEFKRALYGIWLSDKPADSTLKQALLTTRKVR